MCVLIYVVGVPLAVIVSSVGIGLSLVSVVFCFWFSVNILVLIYVCWSLVISLRVIVLAHVCIVVPVWRYLVVSVILNIVACSSWFSLVYVVVFWIVGFVISYWVLFNYVGISLSGYLAVSLVPCWGGVLACGSPGVLVFLPGLFPVFDFWSLECSLSLVLVRELCVGLGGGVCVPSPVASRYPISCDSVSCFMMWWASPSLLLHIFLYYCCNSF